MERLVEELYSNPGFKKNDDLDYRHSSRDRGE